MLGALAARGIRDVAAVDLTRAEIGIPVVRVLVAGLGGVERCAGLSCPAAARAGIVAQ